MNKDELLTETDDLTNSVLGLDIFVNDHFTEVKNIDRDDLTALNGLVASIRVMTHVYANHVNRYLEDAE